MRLLLILLLTIIACLYFGALAADTNTDASTNTTQHDSSDLTIYLEADQVEINDKQQTSTYQGNVKLSRGNIRLLAEKITAHKNSKGIGKFLATGNPVIFNQTATASQKEFKGEALEVEYDAEKEIMKLKKKAKLWQKNDQFSGNLIIYNIAQGTVKASKGNESNARVRVIIQPTTQKNKQNNN